MAALRSLVDARNDDYTEMTKRRGRDTIMNGFFKRAACAGTLVSTLLAVSGLAQDRSLPPLPIEGTGTVESLPERYPDHWFLVHDASFFHMSDGKVYLIDSRASIGVQRKISEIHKFYCHIGNHMERFF